MAVGALEVTHFLAAAMMLLLAGWLLWIDFERRVHRAFALFLVLRAMTTISNRMSAPALDGGYWERVAQYFLLGTPLALVAFLVVYAVPRRSAASRAALWGVLAAAVLVEVAYASDHCLAFCRRSPTEQTLGPLALLSYNVPLATALGGLWLARAQRAEEGPRRSAMRLVALALLLNAVLDASVTFGVLAGRGGAAALLAGYTPSPWNPLYVLLHVVALPLGLAGVALLHGASPRVRAASLGAAGATALVGALLGAAWEPALGGILIFVTGFWRILLPAMVVHALLRHRLFDLDVRVRWTISRGTLAFATLAAFFLAEQLVQAYVSDQFGFLAGLGAAAVLVLARKPVERAGDRLASFLLPDARPAEEMERQQRLDAYRAHAQDAWAEGALDRAARLRLDELGARLGLSLEECARLEREAALGPVPKL
ncbi:MAG TPA: hypothetical protein VHH36_08325 [Candidatus Thermoplasmatota archaeon]|nr:hypothetical protein [Candidatus Thermoplasmatota archaeon]